MRALGELLRHCGRVNRSSDISGQGCFDAELAICIGQYGTCGHVTIKKKKRMRIYKARGWDGMPSVPDKRTRGAPRSPLLGNLTEEMPILTSACSVPSSK
jgi:hypothetical protein